MSVDGDDITMKEKRRFQGSQQAMDKAWQDFLNQYIRRNRQDWDQMIQRHDEPCMSLGWNLRFGMGKDSMSDRLKFIAVNIYDVLNEFTDHDHLKGTLALDAVLGNHMGPRTNNSAITFLHQLTGGIEWKKWSYA